MCIRITKELKQVYENDMKIDLGYKIAYKHFHQIMCHLGYLEKKLNKTFLD